MDEPQSQQDQESSFDVLSVVGILWRRRLIIFAVLAVGLAISFFTSTREIPLYRAAATLEVQAQEMQILRGAGIETGGPSDVQSMGTQIALIKSRALAERVADTIDLVSDSKYANPNADRETRLAMAAGRVMGGLRVAELRGASILQIQYISEHPGETSRIANAVAENFIEMNLERRYNATSYAREFLEERLATTKTALEEAERGLVEYSKEQEIVDLSSVGGSDIGSSLDASSLVALNAALTNAQNDRILAEQEYLEALESPNTTGFVEDSTVQSLRGQRAELLEEYQNKLEIYKPEFPEMESLARRIDSIESSIDAERQNFVSSFVSAKEAAYRSARAREDALSERVAELKTQVLDLRGRSIDYNILQREVDTLRTQYDALLERFKAISIISGVGASQVSILDRAQTPFAPFQPNLRANLTRALLLSLALALGLALLVDYIDDTIKTPDDVTAKLGLRVLGVIPKYKAKEQIRTLLDDPKSNVSEAFSSARTAVHFATEGGAAKSILLTASKSAEGKSTCALAIATAFAAVGKRVLIIDADMRRPAFTYDRDISVGLSGVLSDDVHLHSQIVAGPAPNLYLLPAGEPPANPAELLGGSKIVHLMKAVCDEYDMVIVDSPPAQPFSDAVSLGAICDATIFIIQSAGTHRQTARRTLERLASSNANLIGGVLTKFNNKRYGYGAVYGYGYEEYGTNSRKKLQTSSASSKRQIRFFEDGETTTGKLLD
ncbi:MAG: polysaccharide biosynthesis tyrosine autokinase [Pseudomonadota bacterium]